MEEDFIFGLIGSIIGLAVFTGILYLIREVVCWYLKQNEIVSNQRIMVSLLRDIRDLLEERNNPPRDTSTLGDNR